MIHGEQGARRGRALECLLNRRPSFALILLLTAADPGAEAGVEHPSLLRGPVHRAYSQYSSGDRTTLTVAPDTQYRAGWLHEFFFGAHWRELWATPIEVDVLDLDDFAGGIRPVKRGGGKQTKSLRFKGNDGKEYKFRSMTKDPTAVLPADLRESIAADIVRDQISSSNPVSALVAPAILNAVGVLNAQPLVVMLPVTTKLGRFNEEFGGLLGMIEENPDDSPDDSAGVARSFAGADKVAGTTTLIDRMEDDSRERVDGPEYLKARLVDILLGDWDRHIDQWRWAGYKLGGGWWRWVPVPRDRDQAFAKFDGLLPYVASVAVPQLEGFADDYPEIEDLTWSGRHIDRRFLSGVERQTWDSVARFIADRITDSVIAAAVRMMPEPMYALSGAELERTLIIRRDRLGEASDEFSRLCMEFPDVRGSNDREEAAVEHFADSLRVTIYRRAKSDAETPVTFSRSFHDRETEEVRLIMLGGDDIVRITGNKRNSIDVRVAGGKGDDALFDSADYNLGMAGVAPFSWFGTSPLTFYDSGKETGFAGSDEASIDRSAEPDPTAVALAAGVDTAAAELLKYEPVTRDYGYDWKFAPWYAINPDLGLFIGGGPILYRHSFRTDPYAYRLQLRAGYATTPRKGKIDFTGDFFTVIPRKRLHLETGFSQIDILNYFGAGNETVRSDSSFDAGYYKARQLHFYFTPTLYLPAGKSMLFDVGLGIKYVKPTPEAGTLVADTGPLGGTRRVWYLSVDAGWTGDWRDVPDAPRSGIYVEAKASTIHPYWSGYDNFQRIKGEVRVYASPFDGPVTLAGRTGGEKLWGTFPYYESAFLGGSTNLPGFDAQRFAGSAALYGAVEARVRLSSFMLLVPIDLGLTGLAETGRVYLSGESSSRWHGAAGGGIWLTFIDDINVLSVSVVSSAERTGVYIAGGFHF